MNRAIILSLVLLVPSTPFLLYRFFGIGKKVFHDALGWHIPKNPRRLNMRVCSANCAICGKTLVKSANGSWI